MFLLSFPYTNKTKKQATLEFAEYKIIFCLNKCVWSTQKSWANGSKSWDKKVMFLSSATIQQITAIYLTAS